MKIVLVSGGAVHAHLDDVKIITNKFKGGLIADLAEQLSIRNCKVIYLCNKDAERPNNCEIVIHNGFDDYRAKVLEWAQKVDAVVLGAAVANLIPKNPIKGKFPSHNYKVGDTIPIDFTIAPRVIEEVKSVAPKCHVFGFKLLSHVDNDELIDAAYDIVLASKATTVFANDASNLNEVYAVTKERAVHKMERFGIARWIVDCINDEYYTTSVWEKNSSKEIKDFEAKEKTERLIEKYKDKFVKVKNGLIFGTVAVRTSFGAFITTSRGKNELSQLSEVDYVDGIKKQIVLEKNEIKASLNAPLLWNIFINIPKAKSIVHYHKQVSGLPTLPYAPPGTVRDSNRNVKGSFNIEDHGCFLILDEKDEVIYEGL